ncbi:MAG: 6-carboxytetrahydropterin synthase QueD [Candidatus Omnitrophica bacterium CG07_land_8_20_14_0_80_50_8]|nr:MAG: 6-carboxytetrahydropterin synthase QueD [Candidatus Omnitrophica bacterium CG1_02_49_16]PIU40054.1 MAG: 6-carboxytetrahydropterin synthase QueD [Candidatus Omnitrophica bacterium CG07_land_8_20_14_0_80_50_8]
MYKITKEIHFCYGHRLLDYNGRCAHPHGHNGKIQIELASEALDKRGMVYDFRDIKEIIHRWVDEALDHRMILKKDDPLVNVLKDLDEPYFEMDENPTAEALAKLIYNHAKSKKLPISKVTFWETASSCASYSE